MGEHRLGALALLGDAGMAEHGAGGVEPHGGAVLRRDAGAADAVERGGRIGDLDEARKADAAIDAARAQPLLLGAQAGVVHHRIEIGERLVVRELLELDARRAGRRIGVVGNEVAAAQLQRVHADARRRKLDQALRDVGRDRMADCAVLAHHVLVLEHHAGKRAVVRAGVGAADEVDDLVRLDAAGARIDGVGADAREIVDLERGDGAGAGYSDLGLDAVIAGMDVGDEALQAIGDELDGAAQQLRQRRRRHLVGIGVDLDAERAADVLGQHAHLVLGQPEVLGEQVLHHVRRLGALMDGEALLSRIPVGDDGARLVGDAGMAAEHEGRLDDFVGRGEAPVGIARLVAALEGEVVAERRMDHRRAGLERGLGIGDGGELLVIDNNKRAGILGLCPAPRDDRGDRLALPAGAVDCDRVLRRRLDALQMREHADPGCDHLRKLGAGDDRDHARRGFRRNSVELEDAGMRVRRAHEGDVHHARQHDVADILAAALDEPAEVGARHGAPDIGVRAIERGQCGGHVVGHRPARVCATAATASTIAW